MSDKLVSILPVIFMAITYPYAMMSILWPVNDKPVARNQKIVAMAVSLIYLALFIWI